VEIAGSGKDTNYTTIPHQLNVSPTAAYLHITTNETIAGTQWHNIPYDAGVPLVADMSSDIFSRVLDFNRFGLIYAGAQKNMGAAGVNLVVVNQQLLGKVNRNIPSILDYRNHIRVKSMINTPPVFAIYVAMLTLRWLKAEGGVSEMEKRNAKKAKHFYDTLDSLPLFRGPVAKADRSLNECRICNRQRGNRKRISRPGQKRRLLRHQRTSQRGRLQSVHVQCLILRKRGSAHAVHATIRGQQRLISTTIFITL